MQERPRNTGENKVNRVLLVDTDDDIADVVLAILSDEGYIVSTLGSTEHDAIAAAVNLQEPDCVLLDGSSSPEYGSSWAEATYLAARERAIPTIMFSAHTPDVREAKESGTQRATAANFAAIVQKPFSLDELLQAVDTACGRSVAFNRTPEGEHARTVALVQRLRAAGAIDIRTSSRREWATFASAHGEGIFQLYWWGRLGLYIVGRYDADAHLSMIGQFYELPAAVRAALGSTPESEDARTRPRHQS